LRLALAGAQPLESVRQLASLPGVEVTGTVPDVRPYYSRALAAIVPLLSGSGTRLKILEAMAAQVPVISTPVGAEGLEAVPDRHLLIAEPADAEVWVRHVSLIYESRIERERLTTASFEFVRSRYDWERTDLKLKSIYEGWLQA
jgi:glycosyltransferase involved in cell wall biosynthesis